MYWAAGRLLCNREKLALRCLQIAGYSSYLPRIRARRVVRGRRVDITPPLFPGYLFIAIDLQWHAARWSPGIAGLVMDGVTPARVPDKVIAELRAREIRGLIELPPRGGLQPGDRVRVARGPFQGSPVSMPGNRRASGWQSC
jgi:transcriptional antiterminator RfaH